MQAILNRRSRVLQFAAAMFALVTFAASAQADIFQWEYISPGDPSQGKQQSTTLCVGGAGVNAVPGEDLSNRNLNMANLVSADLTGAYASYADLTNADINQEAANVLALQAQNQLGVESLSISAGLNQAILKIF